MTRGEIIRKAMAEQGITVRRLAFDANLSNGTIQAVLNDDRPANIKSLEAVLDVLGLELLISPKKPTT